VGNRFAEVPLGLYLIRGENVILLGDLVFHLNGLCYLLLSTLPRTNPLCCFCRYVSLCDTLSPWSHLSILVSKLFSSALVILFVL
jgi:hypothetical protein